MDRADISFEKGMTYKDMGLLNEAIAEFEKALSEETLRCRASRQIASCLVALGRIDDAEKVLLHALLSPDLSKGDRLRVYADLAELNVQQDRIESAVERLMQIKHEDSGFFPDLRERIEELFSKIGAPLAKVPAEDGDPNASAAVGEGAASTRGTVHPDEVEGTFQDARRRAPRVNISTPVQYSFDQSTWSTGYSTDISTMGMFVLTHEPVPVGSLVFLKFNLPNSDGETNMELIGQAVRQEKTRHEKEGVLGMGIQFVSVAPDKREKLRWFVAELYTEGGEDVTGEVAKIRSHCDHCGRRVTAPESYGGKYGKCFCGKPVFIPYAHHHPAPDNPLRGYHIAGCRIDRVIGKGSAATVYKGHHLTLDIPVAIKILHPAQQQAGTLMAERFLNEARAIARIKHANIVGVMNAGVEKGHRFIVMQYVAGNSLNDLLVRGEKISVSNGIRLFIDLCKALQAAHEHSMIHGDVKPANILLTPGGTAMLVDFGLVKEMQSLSDNKERGLTMGTPLYMSPEQVKGGHAVEYRSDIYSLGATMYHALAGAPPFEGLTMVEVVRKHLKEKPVPLRQVLPEIPQVISEIIARCMAKSPQNRFQSVEQIKQLLLSLTREMAVQQFKPIYSKMKKRKPKFGK